MGLAQSPYKDAHSRLVSFKYLFSFSMSVSQLLVIHDASWLSLASPSFLYAMCRSRSAILAGFRKVPRTVSQSSRDTYTGT